MKIILKSCTPAVFLSLLLLCSCATTPDISDNTPASKLPAFVTLNEDAGRGSWLIVMLRLESGEELPFLVDTGASGTLLDKSLESKLGKRSGTTTLRMWDQTEEEAGLYAAPKLYLGGTPLMTDSIIVTHDFKQESSAVGRPIMGCLGLDCLRHYCIQLDFEAGKMRFLNGEQANKQQWGKAFALVAIDRNDTLPAIHGNLLGATHSHSMIDTGDPNDGWLMPKHFQQWTNQTKLPMNGEVRSPDGVLGGETYPQISLREANVKCDGIGLYFLSRHLVTLDFPKQTMYLKRTSIGPLIDEGIVVVRNCLMELKKKNQLPGWSKDEHGTQKGATIDSSSYSGTFDLLKNGDSSIYHYQVVRASKAEPWKLRKAWRTDQNNKTVEEYSVP